MGALSRLIAFCVLWLVAGQASAQGWTWDAVLPSGASRITYVSGGMVLDNGPGSGSMFLGRTFGAPSTISRTGLAATVTENLGLSAGGNALSVAAMRGLSWAGLASAAVEAFKAGFELGAPIAKALGNDQFTIGDTRCTATNSGWQCDMGQDPSTTQVQAYTSNCPYGGVGCSVGAQTPANADRSAICSSMQAAFAAANPGGVVVFDGASGTYGRCAFFVDGTQYYQTFLQPAGTVAQNTCPASIDALNPAWSIPAGAQPGPDGKCPTGRYNNPADTYVADRIKQYGKPEFGPELAPTILDKGVPIRDARPGSISGPASVTGSPTTSSTTAPDGTTTTSTKTPTVNYTYGPQTINYTTTNNYTTTTCTGGGSCSTSSGSETSTPEPSEQCKSDPDSLGCAKFGDPPTDAPQWSHRDVTYTPEDLGFAGSCPAPEQIQLTYLQKTLSWSYQPACDVAPVVRVAILALAAFGAISIIILGTKS